MDFDTVITSIVPSEYFERFLNEKEPSSLPYWRMLQLFKIYMGLEKEAKETTPGSLE